MPSVTGGSSESTTKTMPAKELRDFLWGSGAAPSWATTRPPINANWMDQNLAQGSGAPMSWAQPQQPMFINNPFLTGENVYRPTPGGPFGQGGGPFNPVNGGAPWSPQAPQMPQAPAPRPSGPAGPAPGAWVPPSAGFPVPQFQTAWGSPLLDVGGNLYTPESWAGSPAFATSLGNRINALEALGLGGSAPSAPKAKKK